MLGAKFGSDPPTSIVVSFNSQTFLGHLEGLFMNEIVGIDDIMS